MESEATHLRHLAAWLQDNADAEIAHLSGTMKILAGEIHEQAMKVQEMGEVEE